jgi:hypothetical protein
MHTKHQTILKQLALIGDVVFVGKDGSRLILNEEGNIPLQTQVDAVLYFLERLDSDMLELILEEQKVSKEFDKKAFINDIADAFDDLSKKGNTFLNRYEGKCISGVCSKTDCIGFSFVGNKTNDFIDLIIEVKNDKVLDIYECSQFENENKAFFKNQKIIIDSTTNPF